MSFNYITGIDPGTEQTAVVTIDFEATRIIYCSTIDNLILITQLATESMPLLRNSYIGIETAMPMGMKVGKTTFQTIRWEGKFQQAIKEYTGNYPTEISRKHALGTMLHDTCGNDTKLNRELIRLYGKSFMKELNSTDKRAALAVALTLRNDILTKRNEK
jgi:hypothetical protein